MTTIDLSTLDGADGFRITGVSAEQSVGSTVRVGGDINGDHHADIIVGSDPAVASSSFVVFGQASGFAADFTVSTLDGADVTIAALPARPVPASQALKTLTTTGLMIWPQVCPLHPQNCATQQSQPTLFLGTKTPLQQP